MQSPGSVLSREELLRNVWGEEPINPRTVDVRIGRLRRSLLATWHTDPIVTVRGSGYAFKSRSLGAGKTRGAGAAAHARRHKVPT
jgi:two-component system phosphate regulon response regulator PhoB